MTGIELRKLRDDNNLTQVEFAEIVGFSQKTISAWETDRNNIHNATAELITIKINNYFKK